jgi:hypothetical protein
VLVEVNVIGALQKREEVFMIVDEGELGGG